MSYLLTDGKFRAETDLGAPGVGYQLFTYVSGTTTLKATYTDSGLATPNTNPVVLNARGEATVFLDEGAYSIVLMTDAGVVVWTQDGVTAPSAEGGGAASASLGYTIIRGDGSTDVSQQITAANAAGLPIMFVGISHVGTVISILVPIMDTMARLFTYTSAVTIDNGLPVRPEWFGTTTGSIMRAVNSLPAAGGVVQLENKRYPPSYNTTTGDGSSNNPGVDYLIKPNVKIIGRRRPIPASNYVRLTDGSGTIIEGPFFHFAAGLHLENFGVDSGSDVCAAYYSSADRDAIIGFKPNHTSPPANVGGLTMRNLVGLCQSETAAVHALLTEGYDGVQFNGLHAFLGTHGVVFKSVHVNGTDVYAYGNAGDGLLIKSDSYAPCFDVNIANVYVQAKASYIAGVTNDSGVGCSLLIANGQPMARVNVTNVNCLNKAVGVQFSGGTGGISDCHVTTGTMERCDSGVIQTGTNLLRCSATRMIVNNGSQALAVGAPGDYSNHVEITATNMALHAISIVGKIRLDAHFDTILTSGKVCMFVDGASGGRLRAGRITYKPASILALSNATPALSGTWVTFGGTEPPFAVIYQDGRVSFFGKIKSGGAAALFTLPVWLWPSFPMVCQASAFTTAAGFFTTEITINTDGTVVAGSNYPSGTGNYLTLTGVGFSDSYLAS